MNNRSQFGFRIQSQGQYRDRSLFRNRYQSIDNDKTGEKSRIKDLELEIKNIGKILYADD